MTKVTFFVKQFCAIVKGDSDEVQALKVQRSAVSQLKTQIAVLEGVSVELETAIEEAEDAEKAALVNDGKIITTNSNYVAKLLSTHNDVENAKEALENHNAKLEFLKKKLAQVETIDTSSAE